MRAVPFLAVLSLLLAAPGLAAAAPPKGARSARTAHVQKDKPAQKTCMKPAIEVSGAGESATFSLSKCDGTPVPVAIDQLSLLARPANATKPKVTVDVLAKSHGAQLAPGIRRI
ncbi:MAG TPA: hypothetical protein VIF09_01020, partial [Polyangiaceae bacterium]